MDVFSLVSFFLSKVSPLVPPLQPPLTPLSFGSALFWPAPPDAVTFGPLASFLNC